MSDTIAIDFGTSRTKLAYWNPGSNRPDLMRFHRDDPFIPSLFYLFRDSEYIFWGHDAEEMLEKDAAGIVDVLKRKLREPVVRANHRKVSPGELLILLFRELRTYAGEQIATFARKPPQEVFLTIPALYGPPDERVLQKAALQAGFDQDKISLVPEPVAAARAWLAETHDSSQEVVVLDCGGGTIDWAHLRRQDDDFRIVPDCPPSGDRHVGGYDVDLELLNRVKDRLEGEVDSKIEGNRFHYLKEVRTLKERYCRGLPLYPLKIGEHQVHLEEREIQSVLEERFIQQVCENLKRYLEKITGVSAQVQPTVLLVGGSAMTKGLKEEVEAQCGCQTVRWERSEYATVLGAVPGARQASMSPPKPNQGKQAAYDQYGAAVEMAWVDGKLSEAEVERLIALAGQLGLTREKAAEIERQVMGDFKEAMLDRQPTQMDRAKKQAAYYQYRAAVEMAWVDGKLSEAEVERLIALAGQLGLTREKAADIERQVMGDLKEAMLDRQPPQMDRANQPADVYSKQGDPQCVRFCTQCGSPSSSGLKFCVQCGACLISRINFCRECGTSNSGEMKFCTQCGFAL